MKLLSLISFCILCAFFSSCKKTCEDNIKHLQLKYEDSTSLPYTGWDSVWFEISDSTGAVSDTCLFVSQGFTYEEELIKVDNGSCSKEEVYSMSRFHVLKSQSFPGNITIKTQPDPYSNARLYITLKEHTWKLYNDYLLYSYNNPPYCLVGGNIYTDFYYTKDTHPLIISKQSGIIQMITPYNLTLSLIKK